MGLSVVVFRLKYVQRFTDRHGKVRHYFRRPGSKKTALPGLPGSAAFMETYKLALDGKQPQPAHRTLPGSFGALADAYYGGSEFRQLASATQRTYRNITEALRREHGEKPIALIRPEHIRRIMSAKSETPAAANSVLKQIRILMQFAIAEGMLHADPTRDLKRLRSKSDGFATWSEEDIAAFEARWPAGTRQNLALMLLLYTGQRGRSDVTRMGPQHIQGGRIAVQQSKTKKRLLIPIHARLRAAIDACPSGHLTFIATEGGKPYAPASFGNWFADAVRDAGLKGLSAHGLRKGCARRLAEAGCTMHEIAAITGHASLREIEHYTRAASQTSSADAAMAKIK